MEAFQTYYSKYKKLYKELEHGPQGYSASTAYLTHCNSFQMLPSPVGLVQRVGPTNTLKAKNMKMGTNYALALSKSMKHLNGTTSIELPGNRLGKVGGAAILDSLSEQVRNINLSSNKIGLPGVENLARFIE